MTNIKSRRDFVKVLAASSIAPLVSKVALGKSEAETSTLPKSDFSSRCRLHPFNYEGVRLSPGMLSSQFRATRDYYFAIPNDDILKGFRQRAGLRHQGMTWADGTAEILQLPAGGARGTRSTCSGDRQIAFLS